jgi:hypothetical protein
LAGIDGCAAIRAIVVVRSYERKLVKGQFGIRWEKSVLRRKLLFDRAGSGQQIIQQVRLVKRMFQ